MNIRDLPDFVALEHLARSLWRNGESRGAALLVGAGFSSFAKLAAADTPKPPLWNDLRRQMATEIYAGVPDHNVPADPLRLAEEYQALLARAALDDFIRSQVPDHAWRPGNLHDQLMRLPWSDILTTNWDTLLERSAQSIAEIGYEIVSVASDIARAKSPRIVKLHGNIPSGPFIFTEEDYRTYPIRHAPFVNLARQIFLENELCLIGFSGTDPNFLQWSGWVRDNLGASTRRIYLVNVLDLHPAARRLLEARNVAPIDLASLVDGVVGEERYAVATKLFLDFLREAEPRPAHAWMPERHPDSAPATPEDFQRRHRDESYAASLLDAAAQRWQAERESYPGWIVCPYDKRDALRYGTDISPMPSPEILAHIDARRRPRILYELASRFDIAFWQIPDSLFALFQDIATPASDSGLSRNEHLTVATILLRTARENGARDSFDQLVQLIEQYSEIGSDFRAAVSYQKCLWSRDRLDFVNLSKQLQQLAGPDPIWGLRRAGLHCELSEYDKANELVAATLSDLRERQQRDRKSLWVLSRRAWAHFLDRAADMGMRSRRGEAQRKTAARYEDWPLEFKAAKSDPWDELKHVEETIAEARRKHSEETFDVKVHFDAGTYTEQGGGVHFQSWAVEAPSYALCRLADTAGIPIDFGWVTILRGTSRDSVALEFEPTEAWYFRLLRTLRSHEDASVEHFFSRVAVAQMPESIVPALVEKLTSAIEFWRRRSIEIDPASGQKRFVTRSIEQVRWQLEVLSRLAIRLDSERARQLYDLALGIIRDTDVRHSRLFEPLDHLLQRTGEAMPKEMRGELILPAIEFPLQSEIGVSGPEHHWPTPVSHIADCPLKKPDDEIKLRMRVQQLIEATRTGKPSSRADAALRLCYLDDANLLLPVERESYGQALWAQQDPQKHLPLGTHLLAHVFLHLPAPDLNAATRYFTDSLFKAPANDLLNEAALMTINGAATPIKRRLEALRPAREDALRIFDAILALKPLQPTQAGAIDADLLRRRAARQIGPVLAKAIMPVLDPADYTKERVQQLFRLIDAGLVPSAIGALPLVVRIRPEYEEKTVKTIRRAIVGRNRDEIGGAVTAIENWLSLPRDTNHPLPPSIVEQVVAAIANRRETSLSNLIWCARRLLSAGAITAEQRSSLVEALRDLFDETKYARIESTGERELLLSLIRAECVKLAKQLSNLGVTDSAIMDWIEVGRTDPLPEIRWALTDDDSAG
jgi:SIR2-like domain